MRKSACIFAQAFLCCMAPFAQDGEEIAIDISQKGAEWGRECTACFLKK